MRPHVKSPEQRNAPSLLYDCFGISNHFGSVGFGHYTAFGKNPLDNKWYNFDDSSVSPVGSGKVNNGNLITTSAYNLFFRLRSDVNMDNLNFESVALRPNMEYLHSLEENKDNQ